MKFGLVRAILLTCVCLSSGLAHAQEQPASPAPGTVEAALAVEDPADRISALQKFLKTNIIPEQSQAAREAIVASWAQLAEVQLGENNIEKAVVDFRKAIAALPETVTDRFFEATVIRIPQAVAVRGYRNEATGLARLIEKRFAKEPLRLTGVGDFYMTIEASADAVRALETAAKLNADDAKLRRSLGAAYRMGLRLDEAVAEYQQAIKIDPNDKRAYYELANLYRAHGSYADAIKLYNKQLEIDPKHSSSYKGMALAYLAQGSDEQALVALNQARDLRGAPEEITQDIYLQTQMAFYYLAQGKLKQARQAADSALVIEPRYAWARIAAAEVDLAEGKYFEAERNLLAAQQFAGFPTLFFTFGKLYIAVEDFDGALEQFAKAFSYSSQKQFTANLGGVQDVQADSLKELLSREHQAALFLAEPPTSDEEFRIVESLVRFNVGLSAIKSAASNRAAKGELKIDPPKADQMARRKQIEELDQAAMEFVDAEKTRRPFRALHIAQQLAQAGVSTGVAVELADQALEMAVVATELDGSLRDFPNYDRDGRLRIFRGRALDAKGWSLYKAGQNQDAIAALSEAVVSYGPLPEGKRALRRLAAVKETVGELREALDLYIAGYEPPASNSSIDVNRSVVEGLYRQVNGSLEGLDARLKRAADGSGVELDAVLSRMQPADKGSSNVLVSKSGPSAINPSDKTEPVVSRQSEKKDSQFKFSLSTFANNRAASTSASKQAKSKQPPSGQQLAVPLDDPMFAKKPSANQSPEPKSTDSETEVAASTPPPVVSETPAAATTPPAVPIDLPSISSIYDLPVFLTPIMDQPEFFSTLDKDKIQVEEEPPPSPPTLTTPAATQPKVHTRKRRVTVPDDPPNE